MEKIFTELKHFDEVVIVCRGKIYLFKPPEGVCNNEKDKQQNITAGAK